jgi:peptidoglycan LD-endopeptidase LytH
LHFIQSIRQLADAFFMYLSSCMSMRSLLTQTLQKHRAIFHPVVPFTPGVDTFVQLDFTAANKELTDEVLSHIDLFSTYINREIEKAGARYGIGGYNEHRTVYKTSRVFDGMNKDDEPRRLHIGTDIWGKAGTPVMTPLDGTIHSFANNDRQGDYGATIILEHALDGIIFYSLYGHLSHSSLEGKEENAHIPKGELFAWLGPPAENGYWPPHLHFQLMQDIGDWKGDYPGVCKYSEREQYLANCPDPEWILQMQHHLTSSVK